VATKKYQIFISSTFSDLKEQRQLALKAILDLDQIPAGMEAFPAVDMEQFEYIEKVIDGCDYYILIIGARYGSTDSEGVSYTEGEYDYACSVGKTVIALLHDAIKELPMKSFDSDASLTARLEIFRDKVKTGRLVKFWRNDDQLVAAIMQAITRAMSMYPGVGWIRGDAAANDDITKAYHATTSSYFELLVKYNSVLEENKTRMENLAALDEYFALRYSASASHGVVKTELRITWAQIITIVTPQLYSPAPPVVVTNSLMMFIMNTTDYYNITVNALDTNTIKIQLAALGLLNIEASAALDGGAQEYISLTEKGKQQLLYLMAVRSGSAIPVEQKHAG
jgi:hypothetical protein